MITPAIGTACGIHPPPDPARPRRVDGAVPDGGHAADDGGPHQHQRPGAKGAVEQADDAFVAGKEAGYAGGGGGADGIEFAGDVDHLPQLPGTGHVDAVIVARAEVDGGKPAIGEVAGQGFVATQQGCGAVLVPLGLEDAAGVDVPQLADGAIDGADERGIGQGAGAVAQGAGEEVVEGAVGGRIGVGCLLHGHTVVVDEAADGPLGECTTFAVCPGAGQTGQGLFGQQFLADQVQGHGRAGVVVLRGIAPGTATQTIGATAGQEAGPAAASAEDPRYYSGCGACG